jgi:1-deoxy-D-xylulose-5-phosphate reductoisomerase
MNKGFEIIEAAHLFSLSPDQIEVVVHRESIVHSMVEFCDNSIMAQMSVPDMRHCIGYALDRTARERAAIPPLDLTVVGRLTFAKSDTADFPLLNMAVSALRDGGAMPAVLNAANEVADEAFLQRKISFVRLFEVVGEVMVALSQAAKLTALEAIEEADAEARRLARIRIG